VKRKDAGPGTLKTGVIRGRVANEVGTGPSGSRCSSVKEKSVSKGRGLRCKEGGEAPGGKDQDTRSALLRREKLNPFYGGDQLAQGGRGGKKGQSTDCGRSETGRRVAPFGSEERPRRSKQEGFFAWKTMVATAHKGVKDEASAFGFCAERGEKCSSSFPGKVR